MIPGLRQDQLVKDIEAMPRNPNWTRDELILALDLYFRVGRKWLDAQHPELVELSQLLNRLPIHDSGIRETNFRNPQGVSMKIANFLSLDPEYSGKGLYSVSKLDQEIWNDFANEPQYLGEVAHAIRNGIAQLADDSAYPEEDDSEEEFAEGRVLSRLHRQKCNAPHPSNHTFPSWMYRRIAAPWRT